MKESKLAPFAGIISIVLGIVGFLTVEYVIGGILGAIGFIFGAISYADTDKKVLSYIGIFLSLAAFAWLCILCVIWNSNP